MKISSKTNRFYISGQQRVPDFFIFRNDIFVGFISASRFTVLQLFSRSNEMTSS